MRPPSILYLLLNVCIVSAINPSLRRFCLSPLVDSPIQEDDFNNRIKGDACEQKFPYPGTEEQHKMLCRTTLPFYFEIVTRSDTNGVTCRWTTASVCKKEHYQLIFDKCYHVGICGNNDMRLARPSNEDEVRWISLIYGDRYQALHMEKSQAFEEKTKQGFFEDGVLWKTKQGDKTPNDAMVLTRMASFGLYPGEFVETSDPTVNTLCSVRADAIASVKSIVTEAAVATQAQLPSLGTVNSQMTTLGTAYSQTTIKISNGYASPTRNVYQGRLKTNGEVDVEYFHRVCGNICQGCYAATYESFEANKDKMPDGRYWVPAARSAPSDKTYQDDTCPKSDQTKKKSFKVLINPNNPNRHIPDTNQWSDVPAWGCSDADRRGVQIVKKGDSLTYVDVPLFDHQPIMCISGAPVPVKKETGACYANSKLEGGKCKCKPGFVDALGVEKLAPKLKTMGYNENGMICVNPARCDTITEENIEHNAYLLFLDGSCGVAHSDFEYLKDFVKQVGRSLSKKKPIVIFLYAHQNKNDPGEVPGRAARRIINIAANWNINEFDRLVNSLGWFDVECATHTFYNMNVMLDATKSISGKKLIIWVSQQAKDADYWNVKNKLRDNKYDLFGVGVRSMGWEFSYLIPEANARILISGYSDLPNKVVSMVNKVVCDPYPDNVLIQAIGQ